MLPRLCFQAFHATRIPILQLFQYPQNDRVSDFKSLCSGSTVNQWAYGKITVFKIKDTNSSLTRIKEKIK